MNRSRLKKTGFGQSFRWLWNSLFIFLIIEPLFAAEVLRDNSFVDRGEGVALVKEMLSRFPPENTQVLGLLKIRPPDGPITEVPTKMVVRISTNGWEDIYETQPLPGRPGEVLVIKHHGTQPSEYLFGRYEKRGAQPQLQPIAGAELFKQFAGSDFYIADLGLEFLHWPSQKIVKKEMRKSRSCRVVESVNPKPAPGMYSRVLSWIDFETSNLIMAQGYDADNRLLKEFSIRKISRNEGKAQVKEIEMRNDQTDSRTRLEFNLDLPDNADIR
jgi:hypothetical protein